MHLKDKRKVKERFMLETNNSERLVKRYQNRKLYDTELSRYVTLDEIAQIIRSGINIKVMDNKSGIDITYHTLIQLLFEIEKKADSPENVAMMNRVIRAEDGLISSYLKKLETKVLIGHHQAEERPRIHRPTWSEVINADQASKKQESGPDLTSNIESSHALN